MRFISFLIEETDWEDPPQKQYDPNHRNQRRKFRAIYKKRQDALAHELAIRLYQTGDLDPKVSMQHLFADLIVAGPRQGVDDSIFWAFDRLMSGKFDHAEFCKRYPKISKVKDELIEAKFAYEAYGGKLASDE